MTRFRFASVLDKRVRLAIAGGVVLTAVVTFAACGGCGKSGTSGGAIAPSSSASGDVAPRSAQAAPPSRATMLMWTSAKDGDVDELATLATHEGAAGLVEAASDAELRPTAIRAMGYARGWGQLPFLSQAAVSSSDEEARLALDAIVELAARPRRAEDPEDVEELEAGCNALAALARDGGKPRGRRIPALRALRMMPCPKSELPTDLDSK